MKRICVGLISLGLGLVAKAAPVPEVWCVFDPAGQQGDIVRNVKDIALHSQKQHKNIQIKSYRNEQQAIDAFDNKKCSGMAITNFHSRPYNRFIATSSGIGMLSSNRTARSLLQLLNHPYVAKRLKQGEYDVLGFIPIGTAYMVMNRLQVTSIPDLKNKRIGVLVDDPAQVALVKSIGATPVAMDITNPMMHLKHSEVDILPMPIYSLLPYNLKKELGENTHVINFPVAYVTVTLIVRSQNYPKDYAKPMREWFVQNANSLSMQATRWDNSLPAYYWDDVSSGEQRSFVIAVNKIRNMYINNQYYDRYFVELSKRLRCLEDAQSSDCEP